MFDTANLGALAGLAVTASNVGDDSQSNFYNALNKVAIYAGAAAPTNDAAAAVAGSFALQAYNWIPRVDTILRRYAPRPNAVYIDREGLVFDRLEHYIVNKYVDSLRACQIEPRNGQISYTLSGGLQFHRPLIDKFKDKELQLLLVQSDGAYEMSGLSVGSALFYNMFRYSQDNHHSFDRDRSVDATRMVVVSSWTLSVCELKEYIDSLCAFKSDAQMIDMYTVHTEMIDSSGDGRGRRGEPGRKRRRDAATSTSVSWSHVRVKSNKRMCNTIVSADVKNELVDDVEWFMQNESWYNAKGIPYKRGYILTSPPGCGKTSLIKSIAAEYNLPIFILDFEVVRTNAQFSSLMGAIAALVSNKPYILAMEDFDRSEIFRHAHKQGISGNWTFNTGVDPDDCVSVRCLLNEIDGLIESHGRLLFITANDPDKFKAIDQQALMRPGRIDKQVALDYCDFDMIQRMLFHFFGLAHECIGALKAEDLAGRYSPAAVIALLQKDATNNSPIKVIRKLFRTTNNEEKNNASNENEEPAAVELLPSSDPNDDPRSPIGMLKRELGKWSLSARNWNRQLQQNRTNLSRLKIQHKKFEQTKQRELARIVKRIGTTEKFV